MQEAAIRAQLATVQAELKRVEVEYNALTDLASGYERWMQALGYDGEAGSADAEAQPQHSHPASSEPIGTSGPSDAVAEDPEPIGSQHVPSGRVGWQDDTVHAARFGVQSASRSNSTEPVPSRN